MLSIISFSTPYSYHFDPEIDGLICDEASLTEPDMEISIQEQLAAHLNGSPIFGHSDPYYEDDPDLDDPDPQYDPDFDIIDAHALLGDLNRRRSAAQASIPSIPTTPPKSQTEPDPPPFAEQELFKEGDLPSIKNDTKFPTR